MPARATNLVAASARTIALGPRHPQLDRHVPRAAEWTCLVAGLAPSAQQGLRPVLEGLRRAVHSGGANPSEPRQSEHPLDSRGDPSHRDRDPPTSRQASSAWVETGLPGRRFAQKSEKTKVRPATYWSAQPGSEGGEAK